MPVAIELNTDSEEILTTIQIRLDTVLNRLALSDNVKVEIMICTKEKIKELNQKFFAIDTPTDVLSFPVDKNPENLLGTIFICQEIAQKQAISAGISYTSEVAQLAEHGLLHLLGFHHK